MTAIGPLLHSTGLRLAVRLHHWALTRRLAEGADPGSDRQLALRARALMTPRERRRVARGIEEVLSAAEDPHFHLTAAAPLDVPAVLLARADLQALATELRSRNTVNARGVALSEMLLIDAESPLYEPDEPDALRDAARAAAEALNG